MDSTCQATMDNYFALLEFLQTTERSSSHTFLTDAAQKSGKIYLPSENGGRSTLFESLKSSKVFSIPENVLEAVWEAVDDHVIENSGVILPSLHREKGILDNRFSSIFFEDGVEDPPDEIDCVLDYIQEVGSYAAYPKNLPFDFLSIICISPY